MSILVKTMNKVEYKKSVQKQAVAGIGNFGVVCIVAWQLYPINTLEKIGVFVLATLMVTLFVFYCIKKFCKSADCPLCGADLFEVINAANPKQLSFRFCPNCGGEIEI